MRIETFAGNERLDDPLLRLALGGSGSRRAVWSDGPWSWRLRADRDDWFLEETATKTRVPFFEEESANMLDDPELSSELRLATTTQIFYGDTTVRILAGAETLIETPARLPTLSEPLRSGDRESWLELGRWHAYRGTSRWAERVATAAERERLAIHWRDRLRAAVRASDNAEAFRIVRAQEALSRTPGERAELRGLERAVEIKQLPRLPWNPFANVAVGDWAAHSSGREVLTYRVSAVKDGVVTVACGSRDAQTKSKWMGYTYEFSTEEPPTIARLLAVLSSKAVWEEEAEVFDLQVVDAKRAVAGRELTCKKLEFKTGNPRHFETHEIWLSNELPGLAIVAWICAGRGVERSELALVGVGNDERVLLGQMPDDVLLKKK
jgi:hypothetical protein